VTVFTLGQFPILGFFTLRLKGQKEQFIGNGGTCRLIFRSGGKSPSLLFPPYRFSPNRFCPELQVQPGNPDFQVWSQRVRPISFHVLQACKSF